MKEIAAKFTNGQNRPTFLSIIIPAYNEEKRLTQTLPKVAEFVEAQPYRSEVLVVDNGSTDGTAKVVEQFAARHDCIHLVKTGQKGKGIAIKVGMLQAKGEYAFMCDADLAMPISELPKFLPPCQNGYQVAIGSREIEGAVRYDEPGYRHIMGRVYNWLVKVMAVPGFEDTQCGFKCFHRSVVDDLFSHQTIDGFGFDVEVLFVAQKRGYNIVEIPIQWYHQTESKVDPIRDTIRMVQDMIAVRKNDQKGLYDK
ncbi:MAG: glycosyltransferase family 2 protein [Anaerolineae bacterium]|nr:glycosyltransferase family 2 protein [Anaerolineae bacterium]